MRRAFKDEKNSAIVQQGLYYKKGNNKPLYELLLAEQKRFCAYTDEYISRPDAADIDHFNPQLKFTQADDYQNWFVVKHQWNNEKRAKWDTFQPVLHPTAGDFESRIVYFEGDYFAKDEQDDAANNLVKLLNLDDPMLADKRKRYIKRKRDEINSTNQDPYTFFHELITSCIEGILYPRAIKEAFGVDVFDSL